MGRGTSGYVGDALLGLRLLGGLLATPSLTAAAENQQSDQNKLLAIAQGKDPMDVPDVSPGWFSANQQGLYGGLLSGVGGLGQVMAALSGSPVKAPRVDPGETLQAIQLGRQAAKDKYSGDFATAISSGDKEGATNALARINPESAYQAKFGSPKAQTSTNALRLQLNRLKNQDPQNAEIPILESTIAQIEAQQQRTAPRMDVHTNNIVNNTQAMEGAKNAALKQAVETRGVYEDVFPMAQQASRALTDSVFAAKSGWQAVELGFKSALGDENANAAMKSITNAIRLARTVDVGNLNENERRIWEPFVDGRFQTKAEFDAGLRILDKQLRQRLKTNLSVLDAQSWPEMRQGLDLPSMEETSPSGMAVGQSVDLNGVTIRRVK